MQTTARQHYTDICYIGIVRICYINRITRQYWKRTTNWKCRWYSWRHSSNDCRTNSDATSSYVVSCCRQQISLYMSCTRRRLLDRLTCTSSCQCTLTISLTSVVFVINSTDNFYGHVRLCCRPIAALSTFDRSTLQSCIGLNKRNFRYLTFAN